LIGLRSTLASTLRALRSNGFCGAGWVVLVEKPDQADKRVMRAEWSESLTSDRDAGQDVLTLVGRAKFIDETAQQALGADRLKV